MQYQKSISNLYKYQIQIVVSLQIKPQPNLNFLSQFSLGLSPFLFLGQAHFSLLYLGQSSPWLLSTVGLAHQPLPCCALLRFCLAPVPCTPEPHQCKDHTAPSTPGHTHASCANAICPQSTRLFPIRKVKLSPPTDVVNHVDHAPSPLHPRVYKMEHQVQLALLFFLRQTALLHRQHSVGTRRAATFFLRVGRAALTPIFVSGEILPKPIASYHVPHSH